MYHPCPSPCPTLRCMHPPHRFCHTALVHLQCVAHRAKMCGESLGEMCRLSFLGHAMPLGCPCRALPYRMSQSSLRCYGPPQFHLTHSCSTSPWPQPLPCRSHIQHHHRHHLTPSSPSSHRSLCSILPSRTQFPTLPAFLTLLGIDRAIAAV